MSFLEVMRDVLKNEGAFVQEIAPTPSWLSAWRELAALTYSIVREDPRFTHVMAELDHCDVAYLANDWPAFQQAGARVRQAVTGEEAHGR
jgi:hypothetical protein